MMTTRGHAASTLIAGTLALAVAVIFTPREGHGDPDSANAAVTPERLLRQRSQYVVPDEDSLTINEPIYFVVGRDDDTTARFQFSFQYQIFSTEDQPMPYGTGWLAPLHFGYTQTSLWNLSEESAPFEDSSYSPSLFWELVHDGASSGVQPDFLRFGYEHESNGQAGATSRSIDTLFIQPAWRWSVADRDLVVVPKLYGYIAKGDDNDDIATYRGHGDFTVRYGTTDGGLAQLIYRRGDSGRDSIQLDLSWPLRTAIAARTGGFLHLQLFQGYGESLLSYNEEQDLQVRIGFSIVR